MAIVDSSVLIPLARTGRLQLLQESFEEVKTVEEVYNETVKNAKGKKGASKLKKSFEQWIEIQKLDKSAEIAELEGISETDEKLIKAAEKQNEKLITNDKAMINIAKTRNIETYWLTSIILKAVKQETIDNQEGKETLYQLVQEGLNLDNKIYSKTLKKIEEI